MESMSYTVLEFECIDIDNGSKFPIEYTGETVRKPLRGDNRILNVGLSPKQS